MNTIDCYLLKMAVIGGINLVKIAISQGVSDLSMFSTIGSCEIIKIDNVTDLDKLLEHYLVWYKPNAVGQGGWQISGSMNYKAREYTDNLIDSSIMVPLSVKNIVDSISKGITSSIDIMVAEDLIIDKAIIVDGTKRALALFLLRQTDPDKLNGLLRSGNPVTIVTLRSKYSKVMFPCDFLKLCL